MGEPEYSYDVDALDEPLNQIRYLLGDTGLGGDAWLLSDQEISAVAPGGVIGEATVKTAAAALCDSIVARFSRLVDVSEGSASASMSQIADRYRQLAKELRAKASVAGGPTGFFAAPVAGSELEPAFTRQGGDGSEYPL